MKESSYITPICSGDNESALVQVMAWHLAGNKSLPEPAMTHSTGAYIVIHYLASVCFKAWGWQNWKIMYWYKLKRHFQIDGLGQERRNSSALAMELRLSCTNPSIRTFLNEMYFLEWNMDVSERLCVTSERWLWVCLCMQEFLYKRMRDKIIYGVICLWFTCRILDSN